MFFDFIKNWFKKKDCKDCYWCSLNLCRKILEHDDVKAFLAGKNDNTHYVTLEVARKKGNCGTGAYYFMPINKGLDIFGESSRVIVDKEFKLLGGKNGR